MNGDLLDTSAPATGTNIRPISFGAAGTEHRMRRDELFHLKLTDVNLQMMWLTIGGRTSKNKQTRWFTLKREDFGYSRE